MSPWSWAILICILISLVSSVLCNLKDFKKISSILLVAFLGTRLITEFVTGDRFMFDMANDLVATILLLIFVRNSFAARGIILLYALMTACAYIPSTLGYLSIHTHHIIVDVFAFIQIFILFGGIINGYFSRSRHTLKHSAYGIRSRSLHNCSKSAGPLEKTSRDPKKIPIVIKKNGKMVTYYIDTTPYRSQV